MQNDFCSRKNHALLRKHNIWVTTPPIHERCVACRQMVPCRQQKEKERQSQRKSKDKHASFFFGKDESSQRLAKYVTCHTCGSCETLECMVLHVWTDANWQRLAKHVLYIYLLTYDIYTCLYIFTYVLYIYIFTYDIYTCISVIVVFLTHVYTYDIYTCVRNT